MSHHTCGGIAKGGKNARLILCRGEWFSTCERNVKWDYAKLLFFTAFFNVCYISDETMFPFQLFFLLVCCRVFSLCLCRPCFSLPCTKMLWLFNLIIIWYCHRYSREETFTVISIDIRNYSNLYDSLEQYVKGDLLEGDNAYLCEKCEKKASSQNSLKSGGFFLYDLHVHSHSALRNSWVWKIWKSRHSLLERTDQGYKSDLER